MGCNHITCRCKTHFCFKCGSLWDIENSRCTRNPSCDLWDEEMLLELRERDRDAQPPAGVGGLLAPFRNVFGPPPVNIAAPPPVDNQVDDDPFRFDEEEYLYPLSSEEEDSDNNSDDDMDNFAWMLDDGIVSDRHWFTKQMIDSLTCEYCDARLNSINDLRYHLSHTKRHEVYACCGRFFKRKIDFDRHVDAYPMKFGMHIHQIQKNGD